MAVLRYLYCMATPYFDPKPRRYPFPEKTDGHYLVIKKDDGTLFDERYPYVDKSKSFHRKWKWTRLLLRLIVFPMVYVKLGLRVHGKQVLKKNKDALSRGAILVSNHVNLWDYLAILCALKRPKIGVLVWKKNVSGESGSMVRSVGGIPIPEGDLKATAAFRHQVREFLHEGGWLQIYAEGSMWEYYAPIRPFKLGAAHFAIENDIPVLPMAFSYRKPSFIRRLFGQLAALDLNIGQPLYPDSSLGGSAAQIDLTRRLHEEVCYLAHIDPERNPYGPVFHDDKRVDYY